MKALPVKVKLARVVTRKLRKPRVWAATPAMVDQLGSAARRRASNSATQLSRRPVARCIARLQTLMALERECKLRQGDLLVELIERHDMRAIDIARIAGQRPNDLSQLYNTAKMFPPSLRQPEVPYNTYFLAMRMVRKFKSLGLHPMRALDQITARGLTQHRDVTRYFAHLARGSRTRLTLGDQSAQASFAPNHAYHCRFEALRPRVANGSIKLLNVDPPYVYARQDDGRYRSRSARSLDCDSAGRKDALRLVIDLLRDWQPTLVPGGVLLLWQPAQVLLREIADAIEQFGWAVETLVIWDKGRPQPGAFDSPYSPQDEHLVVLKRRGEALLNHDNSYRGNILRFPPASQLRRGEEQAHGFEKPLDLCKFLIGKHTFEGELVVDLCGCTGSVSVAAMEMGRQWVYVESNPANYRLGAARIAERLDRGPAPPLAGTVMSAAGGRSKMTNSAATASGTAAQRRRD